MSALLRNMAWCLWGSALSLAGVALDQWDAGWFLAVGSGIAALLAAAGSVLTCNGSEHIDEVSR